MSISRERLQQLLRYDPDSRGFYSSSEMRTILDGQHSGTNTLRCVSYPRTWSDVRNN